MADIAKNIKKLMLEIPESVKIVAVSKLKPVSDILRAYNAGQRLFGENRVKELIAKKESLPGDIEWHLIGHLQTNKVRHIVPYVSMIQSVDSYKLLTAVNKAALEKKLIINCLLQFHIARETTKTGFNIEEVYGMLESEQFRYLENISIRGVMGIATFTDDMDQVRNEFRYLKKCYGTIKTEYFSGDDRFNEISMGMSGDYRIAVEEGATIVRIGSLIFGERQGL
jgi:pyridoxal phosphate enzyme (YggS family)